MMRTKPFLVALVAALVPPGMGGEVLSAQQVPPVQIHGRVIDDDTNESIQGVTVTFFDSFGQRLGRRVTDELGAFTFEVRNRAAVRIRAGRIGYRQVETPLLQFDRRHFFSLELRLHTEAVLLAPLEVVARGEAIRSPVLSGFDERVARGFGAYFTRKDIEELQPTRVSELLARLPGVRLEGAGRGNRRVVTMTRGSIGPGGQGACPVQIFVDGLLLTRGAAVEIPVDDLVTPSVVEGIEVYRGLSSIPAEFLTPEARCGVVAIWTRRGG